MILYFLEHIHSYPHEDFYDHKNLGVFSSLEQLENSQGRFAQLKGFCDNKDGFRYQKTTLQGGEKLRKNNVYVLQSWDFFPDKYHEKINFLGIFSTKKSALEAKKIYKNHAKKFYLSKYHLNQDNVFWNEGFISEEEAMKKNK